MSSLAWSETMSSLTSLIVTIGHDVIHDMKQQWPCNNLPSFIDAIDVTFTHDGEVLDYELRDLDFDHSNDIEWDKNLLAKLGYQIDEAFLSALFDDAWKASKHIIGTRDDITQNYGSIKPNGQRINRV